MQHPSGVPPRPLDDQADATRLLPDRPGVDDAPDLPDTYGRLGLTLMVKDPESLFAYWELPLQHSDGPSGFGAQIWLRVYETDATGQMNRPLSDRYPVPATGRYHLRVPRGGHHYVARLESDSGEPILTSNVVATPPGRPSDQYDSAWLSQGVFSHWFEVEPGGTSSPGLDAHVQARWLAAGVGSSPMPHAPQPRLLERLDVRMIVTGKTSPGVAVTAQGEPVSIRPDGTFTVEAELQGEALLLAMRLQEKGAEGGFETSWLTLERHPRGHEVPAPGTGN